MECFSEQCVAYYIEGLPSPALGKSCHLHTDRSIPQILEQNSFTAPINVTCLSPNMQFILLQFQLSSSKELARIWSNCCFDRRAVPCRGKTGALSLWPISWNVGEERREGLADLSFQSRHTVEKDNTFCKQTKVWNIAVILSQEWSWADKWAFVVLQQQSWTVIGQAVQRQNRCSDRFLMMWGREAGRPQLSIQTHGWKR